MPTYKKAFQEAMGALRQIYDEREAAAIANRLLEDITQLSYTERLIRETHMLEEKEVFDYNGALNELKAGKPLQYVLGYEWFMGRKYTVNPSVLIPRPETEELVQWIIDDYATAASVNILDIGTGSGCIPISLQMALSHSHVTSCDISEEALHIARQNAISMQANVDFLQLDFLNEKLQETLGIYDVIVSNPPYIPVAEKETLDMNVAAFEPALALFVPDNDALLFYRAIAAFGSTHLAANGAIYCELHVDYAKKTADLFRQSGYANVVLKEDMHGNLRMLKAYA